MFVQVFARGELLLLVADSPQRAVYLYCKHPNRSSKRPCTYCKVTQTRADDGGQLGNPKYDITKNRRTREQLDVGRRKLSALSHGSHEAKALSIKLGIVEGRADGMLGPLFDLMDLDQPQRHVPVESLHADALVISASCVMIVDNGFGAIQ